MPSIDHLVQHLADALPASSNDLAWESKLDQAWTTGLKMDPETARQLLPRLEQLSDQDVEAMLYKLAA